MTVVNFTQRKDHRTVADSLQSELHELVEITRKEFGDSGSIPIFVLAIHALKQKAKDVRAL